MPISAGPPSSRHPDTTPLSDARLRQLAARTLEGNWIHDHTVPSRTLYPHQWSWDCGFIAIGLGHVDQARAWHDMRTLFEAQWADGRVPHIVFDTSDGERSYFPGTDFWRSPDAPGAPDDAETSGVIQPPVHALAAWEIYRRAEEGADQQAALAELRWLYPRLVAQQQYLTRRCDAGGDGLAAIVHPWESGLDNSPAWDQAMAAVPADLSLLKRYQRQDLRVAAVAHRPTNADYARYLALALAYRDSGYDDTDLAGRHQFVVECPAFNAIRAGAEHALAMIAEVLGEPTEPHRERAAAITRALVERLYDADRGMFFARDVRTGERSPAYCVNGLVPLMLPDLPVEITDRLLGIAAGPRFGLAPRMDLPLPSYDLTAPDLDPVRYWRGPLWINVNWLIWGGLRGHGQPELAGALRHSMIELVRCSGFFEYFQPGTGAGIGTPEFSWTASLVIHLLDAGEQSSQHAPSWWDAAAPVAA